jgi:hypothetical protein
LSHPASPLQLTPSFVELIEVLYIGYDVHLRTEPVVSLLMRVYLMRYHLRVYLMRPYQKRYQKPHLLKQDTHSRAFLSRGWQS